MRRWQRLLREARSGQDRHTEHDDARPASHAAERRWHDFQGQSEGRRHHGAEANKEAENGREDPRVGGSGNAGRGSSPFCLRQGPRRHMQIPRLTPEACMGSEDEIMQKRQERTRQDRPAPLIQRYNRGPCADHTTPRRTALQSPRGSGPTAAHTPPSWKSEKDARFTQRTAHTGIGTGMAGSSHQF